MPTSCEPNAAGRYLIVALTSRNYTKAYSGLFVLAVTFAICPYPRTELSSNLITSLLQPRSSVMSVTSLNRKSSKSPHTHFGPWKERLIQGTELREKEECWVIHSGDLARAWPLLRKSRGRRRETHQAPISMFKCPIVLTKSSLLNINAPSKG